MNDVACFRQQLLDFCWRFYAWLCRRTLPQATGPRPQRVLLIRVDERVGNVLLTLPLIDRLRLRWPDVEIDLLMAASKRFVVDRSVNILCFEKREFFQKPWRFFGQMWRLRRRKYDVAIDASHWHVFSTTSALLLAWSGARQTIAPDRGFSARVATHPVPLPKTREPELLSKLRLLEPLGITLQPGRLSTTLGLTHLAWAQDFLAKNDLARVPLLGLLPGARKPQHRAPLVLFQTLAEWAKLHGGRALILWGPGEEVLAETAGASGAAVIAPPTDVEQLAALLRLCRVVVCNDTGPMHLAVATDTPTVAVFVRSDAERWGHAYSPHQVIEGQNCSTTELIERVSAAVEKRFS